MRIILLGNAGAGKSTMARQLVHNKAIPRLSLDEIAWNEGPERKPLDGSIQELQRFFESNDQWIIEGCYSDLVEAALPFCTELRFLNPWVEVCVEHCKRRPWEPEKFSSQEAQQAMLAQLLQWVREYETRDDEYGLKRHRRIFADFNGPKREYTTVSSYREGQEPMTTCDLAKRNCTPCKGGVLPLAGNELGALAGQLSPEWTVEGGHHLACTYTFKNFKHALAFTNAIGEIAERENHHPEITLTWGLVTVRIWTHKIDGLTESDFILAAKISALENHRRR